MLNMKSPNLLFIFSFIAVIISPIIVLADADQIFRENNKAVVVIVTFDEKGKPISLGSGFIVSADGAIVTNYHVVNNAKGIKIKAGDKILDVEGLIHTDKENDLVILKAKGEKLPVVKIGDIAKVNVGEKVYVISSPEGLENTISDGLLSGIREIASDRKFLQITAPISPGSSGGPVFNKNGEVIGVVTSLIKEAQNLNFAVPVQYLRITKDQRETEIFKPNSIHQEQPMKQDIQNKDIDEYLRLAKEYFTKGSWKEAADEYSKAILLRPDDASLYYARGVAYDNQNLKNKAVEDLSNAIAIDPSDPVLYFLRGRIYDDFDYYFYHSSEEIAKGKALRDFDKAINIAPDVALFYYERGTINDISKAIELKADTREKLHALFRKIDEKIGLFEKIFMSYNTDEELSSFYFSRGFKYSQIGRTKEAINDYQWIIIHSDDSGSGIEYLQLNILYNKEKKLNDAVSFYSKEILHKPNNSMLYNARAFIYRMLKQYDKAINDYAAAISLNPNRADNYSDRGDVFSDMRKYDNAIKDYTRAIELDPDVTGDYLSRASVYKEIRRYDEAMADLQKVCDLNTQALRNASVRYPGLDLQKLFNCSALKEFEKFIARGERWVSWGSSENRSYYHDKNGIKQLPDKHIRVWIRMEVDDVNAYIEERKGENQITDGYMNFSHSLTLWEFDCTNINIDTVSSIDYDDNGKVLDSYNVETISLHPIVPESMADTLYKIVCKVKE